MKKSAIVLCFLLIWQTIALLGGAKEAHAAMTGSGTLADPYVVMTPEQLSDIRNNLSAHYKLGADIDLAGYDYDGAGSDTGGWMPIGFTSNHVSGYFTGEFDGNGYTISNMRIDRPLISYGGLFARMNGGATLKNVRLLDINVIANDTAGGLVGNLASGTIERSYATGRLRVTGQDASPYNSALNAGGLVGVSVGTSKIEDSYSAVDVSGWTRIGGIAGTNNGTISNAFASGSVSGNSEVGGLVGYNAGGTNEKTYAVGKVSGGTYVGGLSGRLDSGTTTASYWNKETTGQATSPSLLAEYGLTSENMKTAAKFAGWETSKWGFVDGVSYPYLRSFGMGIGVDPLGVNTYSLHPGQDAVSVTGAVYHESPGEPVNVRFVIRDGTGATVTDVVYATDASAASRSIDRKFSLAGFANGDYSLTVTATDNHKTSAGATLTFAVNSAATAPPLITFSANGDEAWAQSIATVVHVSDSGGGVDPTSLKYIWSVNSSTPGPGAGWAPFASGDTLAKSAADGDWYLHIRATDASSSKLLAIVASNRFRLDTSTGVLSGLRLSEGSLDTAFDGGLYAYSSSVANNVDDIDVTPTASRSTDTITVQMNGGTPLAVTSGLSSGALPLEVGNNAIVVTVTALNGTQHAYTVSISRAAAPPSYGGIASYSPRFNVNGIALDLSSIDTSKPFVIWDVTPKDGAVYVIAPAEALASLEKRNADFYIEIRAPYGSYRVPVKLVSLIADLSDKLAAAKLEPNNAGFKIELIDKSGDPSIQSELARELPSAHPIGNIVQFRIEIVDVHTGRSAGFVNGLNEPLTRVFPLSGTLSEPHKLWGAFRYNEAAKRFEFAPAMLETAGGKQQAIVRSNVDGVFAVVENPASFNDVQSHWSRTNVELAASKGLVNGVGGEQFDPERAVSRAEFAAMLVRALGRSGVSGDTAGYNDVAPDSWYAEELASAKKLGLLDWIEGEGLEPDRPLTREEMAGMLALAVLSQGLKVDGVKADITRYKDMDNLDQAFTDAVGTVVQLGIMTGTGEQAFDPTGTTTRAQAATVFVRMLRLLGLID